MLRVATWCAKCLFLYILVAILSYKLAWIFVLPAWAAATKMHLTTQTRFVYLLNYFLPVFSIAGLIFGLLPFHRLGRALLDLMPGAKSMVEPDRVPAIYVAWIPVSLVFLYRFFTWESRNSSVLGGNNTVGRMNKILPDVIAAEPVERKFLKAFKGGQLRSHTYNEQLAEAEKLGAITAAERELLQRVRDGVAEFISVDDFDSEELRANVVRNAETMKSIRAA